MKTNWQDPQTSEIRSTHIAGLMDAVGKIEDVLDLKLQAETAVPLTEVYISEQDRYRIYQAPAGKRNWASSPAPVIKKNGVVVSSGFTIDYGGGAIIVSPSATSTDTFTADVSYTKTADNALATHLAESIHQGKNSTLEATNTDAATSAVNAPLKSAGGIAAGKNIFVKESIKARATHNGLILEAGSLGGYQVWMYDRSMEIINVNQRFRARFQFNSSANIVYLRVIATLRRLGTATTRRRVMEKIIIFGLNDNNQLENFVESVQIKVNMNDNDISVVAVGGNNQFDLIVNGSTDTFFDDWGIVIESLHSMQPLTPIEAVIEEM